MAERHPYSPGPGGITAAITQFRNSFPPTVTAQTLRELSIAPNNESYVINVLRFIGAIDKEGKQTEKAASIFYQSDEEFKKSFEEMVKTAYKDLFALHKDAAWDLPSEKLVTFFRGKDKTTGLVGKLQAATFQLLAALSGHGELPEPAAPKTVKSKAAKNKAGKKVESVDTNREQSGGEKEATPNVGLTVRIEVNLPPAGDQDTYDRIFRSIRENLLNVPKA